MKWLELLTVAGTTLVAAVTVVVLYSLGVRLTAIAGDAEQASPRAKRALLHRGPFQEALTWLEIHGQAPDVLEHWKGFYEGTVVPQEVPIDGRPEGRRRRRRRGRRRGGRPPQV